MNEPHDHRIKRLAMRSMRRGIKEMDVILSRFSEGLKDLGAEELDLYDALLSENDHDLYQWVSGQQGAPVRYVPMVEKIAASVGAAPPALQ